MPPTPPAPGIRRRAAPALVAVLFLASVATVMLTGALGDPAPGGFVRFDDVRREAFTAVAVDRAYEEPSQQAIVVRVHLIGDASDADVSQAAAWLASHARVRLVDDPLGAPLYLTRENLIATSGPSALGATIKSGMVAEVSDPGIAPCVVAHEILHFLGLHHVEAESNLMYARCAPGKLERSTLNTDQRDELDRLAAVTALTPSGIVTWVSRE